MCSCWIHQQDLCDPDSDPNAIGILKKQIASLESQLASFASQGKLNGRTKKKTCKLKMHSTNLDVQKMTKAKPTGSPGPWYCFQCGEDEYIVSFCADSAPVFEKKKQLE